MIPGDPTKPTLMVRMPFAGYIDVLVHAESADEAWDLALDHAPELKCDTFGWGYETLERITEGNICYADVTEAAVWDEDGEELPDFPRSRWR